MAPTFTYSLQGTVPNQYLRLDSVGGTFDVNTDLVLDTAIWPGDGLPYPVKEIVNNSVFSNNTSARTNLRSIRMDNLTTLSGNNTFRFCTGLTSVSFPSLTTLSGTSIFFGCISLTNFGLVNLGSTITSYPNFTFYECRFVNITLPSQIITLDSYVFAANTALQNFSGPNLTSIGTNTFDGCTSLTDFTQVNLGSTITAYPNYTFRGCRFENITLPNQIITLGSFVFAANTALLSFSGPNLTSIGTSTFSGCTSLTNFGLVNLGATITAYPDSTFQNCRFVTITLPSQITSLGNSVFSGNTALLSFSGPNLTSIGTSTFNGCTSLVTCILGNIPTLPTLLFNNCSLLRNLYIRSTTQPTLGGNAFTNTPALQYIFIPFNAIWSVVAGKTPYPVSVPSVTVTSTQSLGSTLLSATVTSPSLPPGYTIPYYTYQWYKNGSVISGATSATYTTVTNGTYYVHVSDPLLQLTQSVSVNVQLIFTYTVLANGTASITGAIATGTIKLMYISGSLLDGQLSNIPSSSSYPITQIGANAFLGQTGITGVAAPFVTTVGASAFSGCTALAYLYIGIPKGVPTFGAGCFTGCTALTSNVFKNVINTEWTADPSPGGTGLNTYRPLIVTVVASEISVPVISLKPLVQSGGTASKSPPVLTTLYTYYVNGARTQTDITAPVEQILSIRKDTYYLTAGNAFETNFVVSTGGSQGVSKFIGGNGKMTMYIGQ